MLKGPIVDEVRAARAEMFEQAGGSLDGLAAYYLRQRQCESLSRKPAPYKPRKRATLKRAA